MPIINEKPKTDLRTADFAYDLPPELIAQHPAVHVLRHKAHHAHLRRAGMPQHLQPPHVADHKAIH